MVAVGDLTVLVVDVDDVPEVMVRVADDDLDDEDPSAADDKVANRARFNRYAGKRI